MMMKRCNVSLGTPDTRLLSNKRFMHSAVRKPSLKSSNRRSFTPKKVKLSKEINQASASVPQHIHLVDGLNVEKVVMNTETLYVLSDVPKVKDMSKFLTYTFLDTKHGILACTSKQILTKIKDHLELPHYVIQMTKLDFNTYISTNRLSAIVIYNCYSDLTSKATYFLYYSL